MGVPYVLSVFMALRAPNYRLVLAIAGLCSVLTVVGALLSRHAEMPWWLMLENRAVALFAIWATALAGLRMRRLEQAADRRADQAQKFLSQLTHAEHRERRRLAQVLHDNHQQQLVGIKMQLATLRHMAGDAIPQAVDQLTEHVGDAIQSARSLSHQLSPQVLFDGGLAAALRWLAPRKHEQYGFRVHVEADERAEPASEDVKVLLFQAVQELLLNALKHAQVDEAWVRMELAGEQRVRVVVEDRGSGFDPGQLGKEDGGEQLGLLGLRERLEAWSGELWVDSAPGTGTRIAMLVPMQAGHHSVSPAETLQAPQPAEEAQQGEVSGAAPGIGRPIRVLLVDDHKIVREGLAEMLAAEPDLVLAGEVEDGQEAVELAEKLAVDVVVMDVSMPGMGGIEATRRIREAHPGVCVIGLSTAYSEETAEAVRSSGAAAYVNKQEAPSKLIHAIREHVERETTA